MIAEFIFIGIISGLLGLFYRNCLKDESMLFHSFFKHLERWVIIKEKHDSVLYNILGWFAYPLGYCIYCTTPWIAIIIYMIYLHSWEILPSWHWILIGLITVLGTSHLIVLCSAWLIHNHPDFGENKE